MARKRLQHGALERDGESLDRRCHYAANRSWSSSECDKLRCGWQALYQPRIIVLARILWYSLYRLRNRSPCCITDVRSRNRQGAEHIYSILVPDARDVSDDVHPDVQQATSDTPAGRVRNRIDSLTRYVTAPPRCTAGRRVPLHEWNRLSFIMTMEMLQ